MAIPAWDTGGVGSALAELSPWDTLVLGGVKLPGRARIRAHRGRKHDRTKPPGVDGESFLDLGSLAAELEITITVWTPDQLEALVEALDRVLPAPKKTKKATVTPAGWKAQINFWLGTQPGAPLPVATVTAASQTGESLKPLTISHPSLARLRVRSVLIVEEENFQPGPEKGTLEWHSRAVEWMGKGKGTVVGAASAAAQTADLGNVPVAASIQVDAPSATAEDTSP